MQQQDHSLSSLLCCNSLSSCRSSYSRCHSSNSIKCLSLSSCAFNIFCISSIVSASLFDFFRFQLYWSGVTAAIWLLLACSGTSADCIPSRSAGSPRLSTCMVVVLPEDTVPTGPLPPLPLPSLTPLWCRPYC